jgi:hypothetical protein
MSRAIVLFFGVLLSMGCITSAGGNLTPLEIEAPTIAPRVEQTVGDFEFTLEGGKMVTSNKMGRTLNDQILKRWVSQGYISGQTYVPSSEFSGSADYNITLSGSQYGDSSVIAQIFSGLTLLILPYTVDTKFDLQYVIENVGTGERYSASAADSYHTTVELLLFLAAPISMRGHTKTMNAIADHLYQQLKDAGAFASHGKQLVGVWRYGIQAGLCPGPISRCSVK